MEWMKLAVTVVIAVVGAWILADRRVTKLEVTVDNLDDRVEDLEGDAKGLAADHGKLALQVAGMAAELKNLTGSIHMVGGQVLSGLAEIQKRLPKVPEA